MHYLIRDGEFADFAVLAALFPRLADFDIPPRRNPRHLWAGDIVLLKQWSQGLAPQCVVKVAEDQHGNIIGGVLASLCEELLSHEPSAHIEALTVSPNADGHGIGRALVSAIEEAAIDRGARSITLHVFAKNTRARHVYQQLGFDEELIRASKVLSPK